MRNMIREEEESQSVKLTEGLSGSGTRGLCVGASVVRALKLGADVDTAIVASIGCDVGSDIGCGVGIDVGRDVGEKDVPSISTVAVVLATVALVVRCAASVTSVDGDVDGAALGLSVRGI